jgi:hypothetical protein
VRELFIEELKTVKGGWLLKVKRNCPEVTTMACGEEANGCSGC